MFLHRRPRELDRHEWEVVDRIRAFCAFLEVHPLLSMNYYLSYPDLLLLASGGVGQNKREEWAGPDRARV